MLRKLRSMFAVSLIFFLLGSTGNSCSISAQEITNSIGMQMRLIPAGSFIMGSSVEELYRDNDEGPLRNVRINTSYYLGVHEVTQGEWKEVMGTTPWSGQSYVQIDDNSPATYVSWADAQAFCQALSASDGKTYRLPTEAEWEYACRAGSATAYSFITAYPTLNKETLLPALSVDALSPALSVDTLLPALSVDTLLPALSVDALSPVLIVDTLSYALSKDTLSYSLSNYAWSRANTEDVNQKYAHNVGLTQPNAWGLHDMHGNVWEWCQDWHGDYEGASTLDPTGPIEGEFRVYRGGGWDCNPWCCRTAFRNRDVSTHRSDVLGFRVVCLEE
jgi:formylglycine-generating enzyme required for sulfatase activity